MLKRIEKKYPEKLTVYDSVTNFILLKIPKTDLVFQSLLSKGISVRYLGDFLRVSAGNTEENNEFINAFDTIICNL